MPSLARASLPSPEWQRVPLADAVYFQEGPGIRTAQHRAKGIPFLNIRCFDEARGRLDRTGMRCVSSEAGEKYAHFLLQDGDCVLSSSGTIGKVARLRSEDLPCLLNTGVIRLRPKDARLDEGFLYYFLRSPAFQQQLMLLAAGSVQKNVGPSHLRHAWIALPPLPEQAAIVAQLSALDAKIEHCYQLYALLRDWTQCVFRSLPPTGRARPLMEYFTLAVGGDWGEDGPAEGLLAAHCLRGIDLVHLARGGPVDAPLRWVTSGSIARRRLSPCDVLVAASGSGACGESLWIGADILPRFSRPVVYSNFCRRVTAPSAAAALYLDCLLREMARSGEMGEYIHGTSVPNLDIRSLLANRKVAMPSQAQLEAFAARAAPAYSRAHSGEAAQLIALRDLATARLIRPPGPSA